MSSGIEPCRFLLLGDLWLSGRPGAIPCRGDIGPGPRSTTPREIATNQSRPSFSALAQSRGPKGLASRRCRKKTDTIFASSSTRGDVNQPVCAEELLACRTRRVPQQRTVNRDHRVEYTILRLARRGGHPPSPP